MTRVVLVLFWMGIVSTGSLRAETLVLRPQIAMHAVSPYMSILEDAGDRLDWNTIRLKEMEAGFRPSPGLNPNLGLTHSTFWLKVTIRNEDPQRSDYFLVLDYPLMDHLDIQVPDGKSFQVIQGGDQLPRLQRGDWQRTPRFPLRIRNGETVTIYMRAKTEGAVQLPLFIRTPEALAQWEQWNIVWGGTLLGITAVMVIYSLLYGIALRSLTQLSYSLFLLGLGAFVLTQAGMGLILFWGPGNVLTNPSLVLAGGIALLGAGIFFPAFLNAGKIMPRLRYLVHFCIPLGMLLVAAAFLLPYRVGAALLIVSASYCAASTVFNNVIGVLRGYRLAKLCLVAWTPGALGFGVTIAKFSGAIPANWFTENAGTIGIMMGMVLQALANADRVVFLQREQLRIVQEHKDQLEVKVTERTEQLAETTAIAQAARKESDDLLAKILPGEVAEELKRAGAVESLLHDEVSVLFTDFQGFTASSESMLPEELVSQLDGFFSQFDEICLRNGMEKLKTIGDAYMCASGIPKLSSSHAVDACLTGLQFREFMLRTATLRAEAGLETWRIRIGIHSGPVISGVIGNYKFAYDIWGDTVNTASRMESFGAVDEVNISETTFALVKDFFECEPRGSIEVKGKGMQTMYFLRRIKPEFSRDELGLVPNDHLVFSAQKLEREDSQTELRGQLQTSLN
ncbi:MAG: hypothetical protein JNM27_12740 [Leptospirales bacterium]|nr:hypothetical protein [Leptospirales bacterium]